MIGGGGTLTGGTAMSLLEHPDAQALLADAVVTPEQVRGCRDRITDFLRRYLPRFYRAEQRAHATLALPAPGRGPPPPLSPAACSAACSASPASRSPSRPASTASRSRTSSAPAAGT